MAQEQSRHEITPVVFIHGLWLHRSSWDNWIKLFRRLGYATVAPRWPGEPDDIEEARLMPEVMAGCGVEEVTQHFADRIKKLDKLPVVIGHSFGGLIAQKLLGDNLAAAAIAISPTQPAGVGRLPLRQLAAAWPALKTLRAKGAVALTAGEFRYAFGNALSREESTELYTMWAMPSPARPLFQAAFAALTPQPATKVNVANAGRGPLLLIAGGRDNTVPASVVHAQHELYAKSSTAVTEIREFESRGHSLCIDSGWRAVAGFSMEWLKRRVHKPEL